MKSKLAIAVNIGRRQSRELLGFSMLKVVPVAMQAKTMRIIFCTWVLPASSAGLTPVPQGLEAVRVPP